MSLETDRIILDAARQFQSDQRRNAKEPSAPRRSRGVGKRQAMQECVALACHPSQVQERREYYQKLGVQGIEVKNNGDVFVRSFGPNRSNVFKKLSLIDKSASY